jgi:hypothetical protein
MKQDKKTPTCNQIKLYQAIRLTDKYNELHFYDINQDIFQN